jgi:hypothetical protein
MQPMRWSERGGAATIRQMRDEDALMWRERRQHGGINAAGRFDWVNFIVRGLSECGFSELELRPPPCHVADVIACDHHFNTKDRAKEDPE